MIHRELSCFSVSVLMPTDLSSSMTIGLKRQGLASAGVVPRGAWSKQRPDLRSEPARPKTSAQAPMERESLQLPEL